MKRFFPIMNDDTEKGMHFALLAYWLFAFEVIPSWLPLLCDGLWDNMSVMPWFEIGYHVLNAVVVVIMLKTYLVDSFLNVQLDPKGFFKIVGLSSLVMVTLAFVLYSVFGSVVGIAYPVVEKHVAITSGYLVDLQPVFGTICCSLFVPFSIVGLFYASGFAPVCRRSRWLGYVVVTLMLAVPCVLDILWRDQAELIIPFYALQLPMHWIACWTYQKADTVWAPVVTLAIFNLATSVLTTILF